MIEAVMTQLEELLDRHRQALHALPDVTGTGLGLKRGTSGVVVIQVYVRRGADVPRIQQRAEALVGTPEVEVQVMDVPRGYR